MDFVSQELFLGDMIAIKRLLAVASPKHLFTLGQLEKQLETECDYRIEAAALEEVADNMTLHGLMPKEVVVPRPVQDLTTRRMLVMELLDGLKLTEAIRRTVEARAQAKRNASTSASQSLSVRNAHLLQLIGEHPTMAPRWPRWLVATTTRTTTC